MNIRWLILFSAVAEEGSFTRAATRLNVAQPWVSAQVRKLEFELGIDLLERTKSGIALTREGHELLPFAVQVSEGARRFRDLARTMGDVRSKIVQLGSHMPLTELPRLHRLNIEYQRRYSAFSLETERAATPTLLAAIDEGVIDCAACLGPIDIGDERYDVLTIAETRPYILMRRDTTIDLDAMTGAVVGVPDASLQRAYFEPLAALLGDRGAVLRLVPESGRHAMDHHVRQRRGPVLMVEASVAAYGDDNELVGFELPAAPPAVTLLVRAAGRQPGRAATRYWDLAAAELAAH